jgi:hypothetical protein
MPSMARITVGLAVVSAATAGALLAAAPGASATTNRVMFTNLALVQDLTLRPGIGVVTTPPQAGNPSQTWEMVYVTAVASRPGFSSPYLLRSAATGECLRDVGLDRSVVPVPCDANPAAGSPQLWDNHRIADRSVNGRDFYLRFNRASDRVITARPESPEANVARVVSAPAEPISKSGAADAQLWLMRPA